MVRTEVDRWRPLGRGYRGGAARCCRGFGGIRADLAGDRRESAVLPIPADRCATVGLGRNGAEVRTARDWHRPELLPGRLGPGYQSPSMDWKAGASARRSPAR